jgi:hypothetical protein
MTFNGDIMMKKIALLIVLSTSLLIGTIPEDPIIPGFIQINWPLVKHQLMVYSIMATVGSIAFYPVYHHIKNKAVSYLQKRFSLTKQNALQAPNFSEADVDRIKKLLSNSSATRSTLLSSYVQNILLQSI